MKKYQHIIFDLDGTLTDSKPGIINAAVYASKMMGIIELPMDMLHDLIGVPLQDYFRIIYNFNEDQINEAVIHFRKYYGEKGVYENEVYPGITELLNEINKQGKKIYISTAKYEKYAKVVADYFKFSPLLTDLVGADAAGIHATKAELAAQIIQRNNITDLEHTVNIGDKHMDIHAGNVNNVDTIGVAYGFGSREELEKENPTYIVDTVAGLSAILVNK